jgi:tryptophan-rich sensory protein
MAFIDSIIEAERLPPAAVRIEPVRLADWLVLLGFVALCLGAAALGGIFTLPGLGAWYHSLHKPPLIPPRWMLGPIWIAAYLDMAVAAWLVWRRRHAHRVAIPMALFAEQLILNVAWPAVFFTLRKPALAAGEAVLLWVSILINVIAFRGISTAAATLLEIYLLWVTFVAALTIIIWRLNV